MIIKFNRIDIITDSVIAKDSVHSELMLKFYFFKLPYFVLGTVIYEYMGFGTVTLWIGSFLKKYVIYYYYLFYFI